MVSVVTFLYETKIKFVASATPEFIYLRSCMRKQMLQGRQEGGREATEHFGVDARS